METDDGKVWQARAEEESHIDLLNHCAICLIQFGSENCKSGRVVLEGVSLKHLWSYFLETSGEDGGSSRKGHTWTFVNSMKNGVTTTPSLCLECSELILELVKRHQAYLEAWRCFQVQVKVLHSLLVEEKNMHRYNKFQESLECAEELDFSGKQQTRMFLESIRSKRGDTDDQGIFSESIGDYLESCDEERGAVDVKEERLDETMIADVKSEPVVEYTRTSDAFLTVDDHEPTLIKDETSTQMETEYFDERSEDNNNSEEDNDHYEPSSNTGNTDTTCGRGGKEQLTRVSSLNTSRQENPVVQRNIINYEHDDYEPSPNVYNSCGRGDDEVQVINISTVSTSRRENPIVQRNAINHEDHDFEPSSNTVDSSCGREEEEPLISLTTLSTSRRKNSVAKRSIIEDEDPFAEISGPSFSGSQRKSRKVTLNKCRLCNFVVTPLNRKRHYVTKHRNHPYNCDICADNILPEDFPSHLEAHVGEYITKCPNIACSYVAINSQRLWKLHLSRRDQTCTDSGRKYSDFCAKIPQSSRKCEYCNGSGNSSSCMSLHKHVLDCHESKSIVKPLSCPVETCDKKFAYRESVQLHLSYHVLSALIFEEQPCTVCYQLYMPPDILTRHLKGFHKFSEIIKCEYCPYVFGTRKYLLDHMCEFHVKTLEGVRCDICKDKDPASYTRMDNLRAHYYQVHQIGEPLICEQCGYTTFLELSLHFHKLDHDNDRIKIKMPKELIKCDMCEEKFISKLKHWAHMRDIHGEKRPHPYPPKARHYSCEFCDQIFNKKPLLLEHYRTVHPKTHVCESCGKKFKKSSSLANHRKLHEGEKPFVCEVCAHAFAQQGDLNSHMRIHTGEKPYKCSMCTESFRQRTGLRKHSLAVHKKDKTYVCSRDPSCGKSFTTFKELANHELREHENVCHLCTKERKEFATRNKLHAHIRLCHRSTLSFKCDQCGVSSVSQAGLEVHRIKKHNL